MKRVLVVVTRQIGDVLLTTPLIRHVRLRWPEATIDVVGFSGTLGMLAGNPDVNEAIAMPAKPGLDDTLAFARRLWRRYDLALVADPGDRAHLIGFVAARERAGIVPAESASNWWKRRLLAHAVVSGGDLASEHVVAEKLRLLERWGPPDSLAEVVAPSSAPLPTELLRRLAPGYVVVHTPSMFPYKQWPLASFRELVARLAAAGRQVVLTGSGSDADRAAVAAMKGAAGHGVATEALATERAPPEPLLVDAGVLDFNQLAALIRGAALYIGPDTSVSHLAAACNVPVLAIFGPTNPQRWAPWPARAERFERIALSQTIGNVTLVQSDLHCVPCGKAGCEDHRQSRSDCLQAISAERVAAQALALLHSD